MFGSSPVIGVKPAEEYQFRVFTTPGGPYFKGGAKPITIKVSDYDRAAPNGTGHVKAGLNFLEVKTKNNHGRTKKKRIAMEQFDALHPQHDIQFHRQDENFINYDEFLRATLKYDPENLTEQLENRFDRITLVNKARTERLTIDTNLRFNNIATGQKRDMGDIVIIELKRDGNQPSPILGKLCDLHIHPHGFSKYCIGSALTNDSLRRNRIKPRLRSIQKILSHQ